MAEPALPRIAERSRHQPRRQASNSAQTTPLVQHVCAGGARSPDQTGSNPTLRLDHPFERGGKRYILHTARPLRWTAAGKASPQNQLGPR